MSYVLRFDEIDRHCLPMVGGKGANLGEMAKASQQRPIASLSPKAGSWMNGWTR
ncbi:hypothetical protein [Thermoactinomyces daqus]|uniref:hypothetical protein n=1 Tax=Thermoactinomyces daqus TaxID=1329516 RepID=UPI000AC9BCDB|nr:hypothetical protein [Thermoactinomyces daqus]